MGYIAYQKHFKKTYRKSIKRISAWNKPTKSVRFQYKQETEHKIHFKTSEQIPDIHHQKHK